MSEFLLAAVIAVSFLAPAPVPESVRETRKLYLRARTDLADGKFREALDIYRKLTEQIPGDAVVRYTQQGRPIREETVTFAGPGSKTVTYQAPHMGAPGGHTRAGSGSRSSRRTS